MFPCVRPLSGTGTTRSLSRPLSRPRPVVLVRELLGIGNDGKAKATSGPQHQAEDQGGEDPDGLVELEDSTTMDGTTFTTPFAEKPVDGGEDHNVWIYYLITAGGGGVKKVLREKGSKSSDLYPDHPGNVRRTRPSCTTRGSCRPDEEVFQFGEELGIRPSSRSVLPSGTSPWSNRSQACDALQ